MPHHFPEKDKGCEDGLTAALCHQTLVQQEQQFWEVRASVTCNQLLLFCDTKHDEMPHRQSQSQLNGGRRRETVWIAQMTPHVGLTPKSVLYGYICSYPGTLGFWPKRYWRKRMLFRPLFCERNCIRQWSTDPMFPGSGLFPFCFKC